MTRATWLGGAIAVTVIAVTAYVLRHPTPGSTGTTTSAGAVLAAAPPGVIRFQGTVEATRARTVLVPRLAGQLAPTLVITRLVAAGAHVQTGDVIVEFDRQEQMRIARDRQADVVDLDGQIQKKKSEQAIARAGDETALQEAERNVGRAALDVKLNALVELVSRVQAEKYSLGLEQATAKHTQLKTTFDLKRRAEEADVRILEIRRARAELALQYAQNNAQLMSVTAPFSGLVVLKQVWKGNSQAPVGEGEEVRPGLAILDIVDASAMQVRALVNQADVGLVTAGQPARIRLDAYPALQFDGTVDLVAPLGVASGLTPKVHSFTAIISIRGTDPQLMPDLTASVEVASSVMTSAAATLRAREVTDMAARAAFTRLRWWLGGVAAIALLVLTGVAASRLGGTPPNLATAEVTRGDFLEIVEIRGDVRPFRSVVVTAPYQAGELQILKLATTGQMVKKGDVVAEFDALSLRNTIQDKQGELRQAIAERDQAREQAKMDVEADRTAVLKADFDVRRARLDLGDPTLQPVNDVERAKLSISDAEQRLTQAHTTDDSHRRTAATDAAARDRRVAKIQADIDFAQRGLDSLKVFAPADGTVNVLPNYRNSSPMGPSQEFRTGDKAWAGAQILELPDLSSVHITSRIDETDRGQLKENQTATVRIEAVPDREYHAAVSDISVLARVDFSSGWPPAKNFDINLSIVDADTRLRPGMSAVTRIATGRIPDMLLLPTAALFPAEGRLVVYRRGKHQFDAVPVDVVRRGREQVAVKGNLAPGDHVSLVKPPVSGNTGPVR